MRKIEQQTIEAIKARKDWRCSNMAVYYISAAESGNPHGGRCEVYLHGNHIADYWSESGQLEVNTRTDRSVAFVACPNCKSIVGEPCRSTHGDGYGGTTHFARRNANRKNWGIPATDVLGNL